MYRTLVAMLLSFALTGMARAAPALTGTFIQLLQVHSRWTDSDWHELVETLNSIGVREIIVQWSVLDDTAFYSSKTIHPIANAPLEKLLSEADGAGLKVRLGLANQTEYWTKIESSPESVESYLRDLRVQSIAVAGELSAVAKNHASFNGWYIPEEIDDVNWRAPERRRLIVAHLAALGKELRKLSPASTIAISTFSQGKASPEFMQGLWSEIIGKTPIDILLFQDGFGTGKLEPDEAALYLQAARAAAEANHSTMEAVVELFRQVGGPPISEGDFRATPSTIERIKEQMGLAAKYSNGGIAGFSVPEYMTAFAGADGIRLLSEYRSLIAAPTGQ